MEVAAGDSASGISEKSTRNVFRCTGSSRCLLVRSCISVDVSRPGIPFGKRIPLRDFAFLHIGGDFAVVILLPVIEGLTEFAHKSIPFLLLGQEGRSAVHFVERGFG